MFDEKINRIIGGKANTTLRQPVNHLGKMPCNINPNDLRNQIKMILDRFPEVKNATGKISIELADGKKTILHLDYKDR